jgi:hypothetical protein
MSLLLIGTSIGYFWGYNDGRYGNFIKNDIDCPNYKDYKLLIPPPQNKITPLPAHPQDGYIIL